MKSVRMYHIEGTEASVMSQRRRASWNWLTDLDYAVYFVGTDKMRRNILCANTTNGLINLMTSISMDDAGWIGRSESRANIQFNTGSIDNTILRNSDFTVEDGASYFNDTISISKNTGNNPFTAITFANTYSPTGSEQDSGINLDFKVMGSRDGGTSYSQKDIGRLAFEKDDDFYHTSAQDELGAFAVYLANSGTLTQSFRATPNSFMINAGKVVNFVPGAPFHVKYGTLTNPTLASHSLGLFTSNNSTSFNIVSNAGYSASLYLGDSTDGYRSGFIYNNVSDELDFRVDATNIMKASATGIRIQPSGVVTASAGVFEVIQGTPSTISPTSNSVAFWFQSSAAVEIVANPTGNSVLSLGNYTTPGESYLLYQNSAQRLLVGAGSSTRMLISTYGVNIGKSISAEPNARLELTQENLSFKPVLKMTQGHSSISFTHFSGTALTGGSWQSGCLVSYSPSSLVFANTYTIMGFVKAQITDSSGKIISGNYMIPFCTVSNT